MGDPGAVPRMIVADTYQLAHHYAREHELGPEGRRWKYISDPRQVCGYRDGHYVTIWGAAGALSPREASARLDAIQALRMAGFTHVEDA